MLYFALRIMSFTSLNVSFNGSIILVVEEGAFSAKDYYIVSVFIWREFLFLLLPVIGCVI